jgi:anti-anti-sigma factor
MDAERKPDLAFVAASLPTCAEIVAQASAPVLKLRGAVPMDEADRLREVLPRLLASDRPNLIIDLSEASFIGSLVLVGMLQAQREAQRHGGKVVIAAPQPTIAHLLHVARINRLIPVFDDRSAAEAAFAAQ